MKTNKKIISVMVLFFILIVGFTTVSAADNQQSDDSIITDNNYENVETATYTNNNQIQQNNIKNIKTDADNTTANNQTSTQTSDIQEKKNRKTEVENIRVPIGDVANLTAHISTDDNTTVNTGSVIFFVNNTILLDSNNKMITANVINSTATLNYTFPYSYRNLNIKYFAVYLENDQYNPSISTKGNIALPYRTAPLIVTTNDTVTKMDHNITFTAYVNDTKEVNDGVVIFKINGLTVKNSTGQDYQVKVVNNTASMNYTIPDGWSAKAFKLTAVYANKNYKRLENKTYFSLNKTETHFDVDAIVTSQTPVTIQGQLLDEYNHPVLGQSVVAVKINGTTLLKANNKTQYFAVNNGTVNITIDVDEKYQTGETYTLTLVTGDRVAYLGNRFNTNITFVKTVENDYITGLFVNTMTITQTHVQNWVKAGITDVYVRCINYTNATLRNTLQTVLRLTNNTDIRVHAVINCFYDAKTKTWISPNSTSRMEFLKENLNYILTNMDVDGVCLDYLRYPGTDGSNSNKQVILTQSTKTLVDYINSKGNYTISACVMPEGAGNAEAYGQNYTSLGKLVDYLMPMTYKGNYRGNTTDASDSWVTSKLDYIIKQVGDKNKVVTILQTYWNDNNRTNRPISKLEATMQAIAEKNAIRGISLFLEGNMAGYTKTYQSIMENVTS
jgi:hypothetical protein